MTRALNAALGTAAVLAVAGASMSYLVEVSFTVGACVLTVWCFRMAWGVVSDAGVRVGSDRP